MDLKDDVLAVKHELEQTKKDVKQNSFAMELLTEEKQRNQKLVEANARMFIMWIITFVSFICLLGYTIYLLNDIEVVETETSETYDINQNSGDGGNNNFINGNDNEVNNG